MENSKEDVIKLMEEVYAGSAQLNYLNYTKIVLFLKKIHSVDNRRWQTYLIGQQFNEDYLWSVGK